jgi:hypothetical protein
VDLASEIDGAGQWIDSNVPGDPLVRLLVLPSFFLYAFWLVFAAHDEAVIIDMPEALEIRSRGPFEYQVSYDSNTFLRELRRLKRIKGVS